MRLARHPRRSVLPFCLAGAFLAQASLAAPPNVLVNDPTVDGTNQDTQSNSAIVLGSGGTVIAAFVDSGSATGGANRFTGFARSTDGGASWTDLGALPPNSGGDAGYPTFARSASTGTILLATDGFTSPAVIQVFRSTTDGASFAPPVNGAAGGGSLDKASFAVDNFPGAGQGNFYLFFRDFATGGGMTFTRSLTDGVSFSDRRLLTTTGLAQGAWLAVGADHAVYAFWLGGTSILVRKSTDRGLSFAAPVVVATVRSTGTNGDLGLGGGFRTNAFPQAVANPNDPLQLYVVYPDKAPSGPDKANVYLTRTSDGGATWSTPQLVNADGGTNDNWGPVLAITPDGTGLFVSWYDRRLDPANSLIDVFGRNGTISGSALTFGSDYRITDASFPVVIGQDPILNTVYMGDYDTATADNTAYYRAWGDNRLAHLSHAHQPDVRFARVPKSSPGPDLVLTEANVRAESCSPQNAVLEPGEAAVITLGVTNVGGSATTNLVGTLAATGGVTFPSGPQSFGAVAPGASASRAFNFTAAGSCGGTLTASLDLQDGASDLGTTTYTFPLGASLEFSNPASITINDNTSATPYPASVTVSGITAPIDRATVTLRGLSHTFPSDVDALLVAPGGQSALFMSDLGGGTDASNLTVTFDDLAAFAPGVALENGTFRPADIDPSSDVFAAPAPPGPYGTSLAPFAGMSGATANGTWNLYLRDDALADFGALAGGWTLTLRGASCSSSCTQTVPLRFFTLPPCRLIDTRGAAGALGGPALEAGADRSFTVAGVCGIPPEAQALALNVTVVGGTSDGHLRLFAGSTPRPLSSSINFSAGRARANNAVVGLSAGGVLTVFDGQPSGSVHLLLDVSGYYSGWP